MPSFRFVSLAFKAVRFFSLLACGDSLQVRLNFSTHFLSPRAILSVRASTASREIPVGIRFSFW